ncbi:MAG: CHAT domain-containing protein [Egibacteraceae bacterium]
MTGYADLEIGVHHRDRKTWTVELRFNNPKSDADDRLEAGGPLRMGLDLEALRQRGTDADAYGQHLTESLFGAPNAASGVGHGFVAARQLAQSDDLALRVRLLIGASAPELHALRWETLRDPQRDAPLLTSENLLFSRYLSSRDWRPVGIRSRSQLRALAVVANPSNVADYAAGGRRLAPVDVAGELERVESALLPIPVTPLASTGKATLAGIKDGLREGHHILYLVCHGWLADGEPQILLEDAAGYADRVPGADLIDALRDLRRPPRLVVLASCQSAGAGEEASSGDEGALAALGPRMAEAGVPAVLAMQGNVTMRTVAEFMPVFFKELNRDGQIDRAIAVARGAVHPRPDWWVPVLFMRLKSGRFWYATGFTGGGSDIEKWPALYHEIREGSCTPILGPGLTDGFIGSRHELARGWARRYRFPLAPHDHEDLAHVAQFLSVNQSPRFPRYQLRDHIRRELLNRYGSHLPAAAADGSVDALITAVGAHRRSHDPEEPHAALARLPFTMFITTQHTNLLADALAAEGKDPQVELCRWKDRLDEDLWPASVFDDPASRYRPSRERPLVYHLFGHIENPQTLVLTEDDYFDFLIGVTRDSDLIPGKVRRAFTDSALLFLGFRMDEWDFRVLFRSIVSKERGRADEYPHVAAQIDPEESHTIEPDRARRYLERYFSKSEISIYWGSVEDFLQELSKGWQRERR